MRKSVGYLLILLPMICILWASKENNLPVGLAKQLGNVTSEKIKIFLRNPEDNRGKILQFLKNTEKKQKNSATFLIINIPERDLKRLSSEFLLENLAYSFKAWNENLWKYDISQKLFNNYILLI